jgi:hypothetical protein
VVVVAGQLGLGANMAKQSHDCHCRGAGLQVGLGSNMTCCHSPSLKLGGGGSGLGLSANTVKQSKGSHHWGAGLQVGLGSDTTCHHSPSLKLGGRGGWWIRTWCQHG